MWVPRQVKRKKHDITYSEPEPAESLASDVDSAGTMRRQKPFQSGIDAAVTPDGLLNKSKNINAGVGRERSVDTQVPMRSVAEKRNAETTAASEGHIYYEELICGLDLIFSDWAHQNNEKAQWLESTKRKSGDTTGCM
jgi:hypothetical protein